MGKDHLLSFAGMHLKDFETPLYVYFSEKLKNSVNSLMDALGQHVDILFSLKSNPNPSIVSFLKDCGLGADVSSLFELKIALKVGMLPENIVFVGPVKTEEAVNFAIEKKIYAIAVESFEEMQLIDSIGRKLGQPVTVLIRINPSFKIEGAPIKMGGVSSQFGIDEEVFFASEEFRKKLPGLSVRGIHVYNGSRSLDARSIYDNISNILELSVHCAQHLGIDLSAVDFGGGFGIPYFDDEQELDLGSIKDDLSALFCRYKKRFPRVRLIAESGRYIIGPSGYMVSRVQRVKHSRGKVFVILDAGYNVFMASSQVGSFVIRNFKMSLIPMNRECTPNKPLIPVDVVGPLCTPGDVLARQVKIPLPEPGDLLVFGQSGAYGPTASPVGFISHGFPEEIYVNGEQAYSIRHRDTFVDILRGCREFER